MAKVKLLVVGHARHGKDTVGELLRDKYMMRFQSSSMFCASRIMMPYFESIGRPYASVTECYEDRGEHRKEWFDQISAYCEENPSRLGRDLFSQYDVYCGVRNRREFNAMKNRRLFTFSIFVDALSRLKPEPKSSMQIEPWMCDYVLDNNGTLEQLQVELDALMRTIMHRHLQEPWR